tara:strand:- start:5700 stop:6599 length:900 start_codon:yes stop_codon:yes gene_type:complete
MLYKMTDDTDKYTKQLKYNAFMGTIAICVVYAIIALAMILYINLTEQGKALYSDLKPFALTFIFGTLFIIMVVTLMVVYWEPEQATKKEISDVLRNPLSCPDYYTLSNVDPIGDANTVGKDTLVAFSSNIKYNKDNGRSEYNIIGETDPVDLGNYIIDADNSNIVAHHRCIADPEIYITDPLKGKSKTEFISGDITNHKDNTGIDGLNANQKKALASFTTMYGGNNSGNIIDHSLSANDYGSYPSKSLSTYDCSTVYPEYLAQLDAKEYINNNETGSQNLHRCGWAKACRVPWTSAGCS